MTEHSPTGIDLPNVIGVVGTDYCSLTTVRPGSAYLAANPTVSPHLVAAPSMGLPLLPGPNTNSIDGQNSFATPLVTSLVAILRSIDPDMTPTETVDFLAEQLVDTDSYHTALSWAVDPNGNYYPVINYARAIGAATLRKARAAGLESGGRQQVLP